MPTNISDSDSFTNPIQAPVDGESATGASVQLPAQGLANRTRYLLNRLEGVPVDANVVLRKVTALSTDHPAEPANIWKSVDEMETGWESGVCIRTYVGNHDNNSGLFCVTVNARWDADTQEWSADDPGEYATMWTMAETAIAYLFHAPTASAWSDSSWDGVSGLQGLNDLRIAGEYRYAGAKIAKRKINLSSGLIWDNSGPTWTPSLGGTSNTRFVLASLVDNGVVTFPVELPTGSIIRAVSALVKPGDGTGTVGVSLRRSSGASIAPATEPAALATVGSASSSGTSLQTVEVGSLSETVNQSPVGGNEYFIQITASSNGQAVPDHLFMVAVDFDDFGLRNT